MVCADSVRTVSVAQAGLVPGSALSSSAALALSGIVMEAAVTRERVAAARIRARRRRPSLDIHQSFRKDPVTGGGVGQTPPRAASRRRSHKAMPDKELV